MTQTTKLMGYIFDLGSQSGAPKSFINVAGDVVDCPSSEDARDWVQSLGSATVDPSSLGNLCAPELLSDIAQENAQWVSQINVSDHRVGTVTLSSGSEQWSQTGQKLDWALIRLDANSGKFPNGFGALTNVIHGRHDLSRATLIF